jgi:ribosomal protein L19E
MSDLSANKTSIEHKPNAVISGRATRDRDKASTKTSTNKPTWQGLQNAQTPIVEDWLCSTRPWRSWYY